MIRRSSGISCNDLTLIRMDGALSVACSVPKLKICKVTIEACVAEGGIR
jgi:hypothetical protein